MHDIIYRRSDRHVQNVHRDIIVREERLIIALQISEKMNVHEEQNIVENDRVHVVQYRMDIIRHHVMHHEINVNDRLNVIKDIIVQVE